MTTPANCCSAVAAIVLAVVLGATPTSFAQDAASQGTVSLRGAGSTFSAPLYRRWIAAGTVSGERYDGPWANVGTPADLAALDRLLQDATP